MDAASTLSVVSVNKTFREIPTPDGYHRVDILPGQNYLIMSDGTLIEECDQRYKPTLDLWLAKIGVPADAR